MMLASVVGWAPVMVLAPILKMVSVLELVPVLRGTPVMGLAQWVSPCSRSDLCGGVTGGDSYVGGCNCALFTFFLGVSVDPYTIILGWYSIGPCTDVVGSVSIASFVFTLGWVSVCSSA